MKIFLTVLAFVMVAIVPPPVVIHLYGVTDLGLAFCIGFGWSTFVSVVTIALIVWRLS